MSKMKLHVWLAHSQHHLPVGTEAWAVVRKAAMAIEAEVRRLGVELNITDDAWSFKALVLPVREQFKAMPDVQAVPSVIPLFNAHIDPDRRTIRRSSFFAIYGWDASRAVPLLCTATGAGYEGPIRGLLEGQYLWADIPALHAPFEHVAVAGDDPALDRPELVSHCGTTWVDIEFRRKGLGNLLARLNVLCAWLKFGSWPVFGTIPVPSNLAKTFNAERVIGRATFDGTPSDIIYFSPAYLVAIASSVPSLTPP